MGALPGFKLRGSSAQRSGAPEPAADPERMRVRFKSTDSYVGRALLAYDPGNGRGSSARRLATKRR